MFDMQQFARRLVLPNDTSEMTDRDLDTEQRVEILRRQKIRDYTAALLIDKNFVGQLFSEWGPGLVPFFIESTRYDGDPTAFRTECNRIALGIAEDKYPVGSVTVDDL